MSVKYIQVEKSSKRAIPGIIKFVKADPTDGQILSGKDGFRFANGTYGPTDLSFYKVVVISETEPIYDGEAYLIEGATPEGIHFKDKGDGCAKPYCNKILVMPDQFPLFFLRLNGAVEHNTKVEVEIEEKYIEPDKSIHCNRGDDITVVKLNVFNKALLNFVGYSDFQMLKTPTHFTGEQILKVLQDWEDYKHSHLGQGTHHIELNKWFKEYMK
jgi:hypothetical protein